MKLRAALALVLAACAPRAAPRPAPAPPVASVRKPPVAPRPRPAALPPTPFHVVVRAPAPIGVVAHIDTLGAPLPLVERTDEGLTFASEYVRASARGAERFRVDGTMVALQKLLPGRYLGESADGTRWIRPGLRGDGLIAREQWHIGGGPRLDLYRQCGADWGLAKRDVSYTRPTRRGDALLAIEHRIESESGGDPKNAMLTRLKLPRLARLDGRLPVPSVPAGVCPETLAAAKDGTLLVVGTECIGPTKIFCEPGKECDWTPPAEPTPTVDVGRYAPGAATGTFERIATLKKPPYRAAAAVAISSDELYVAIADRLFTFDGKSWSESELPSHEPGAELTVHALAASPSRTLWLAMKEDAIGRLYSRPQGGTTWQEVALPPSPDDEPLDDGPPATEAERDAFYGTPPPPNRGAPLPIVPFWIDASDSDEILVLGRAGDTTVKEPVYPPDVTPGMKWAPPHTPGDGFEIVLLSTRRRAPVLRIPSQLAQVREMTKARPPRAPAHACAPVPIATDPAIPTLAPTNGGPGGLTCCLGEAFYECPNEAACYGPKGGKHAATCKRSAAKDKLCQPPSGDVTD